MTKIIKCILIFKLVTYFYVIYNYLHRLQPEYSYAYLYLCTDNHADQQALFFAATTYCSYTEQRSARAVFFRPAPARPKREIEISAWVRPDPLGKSPIACLPARQKNYPSCAGLDPCRPLTQNWHILDKCTYIYKMLHTYNAFYRHTIQIHFAFI